jgi:glutamate 5-kinase
MLSENKRVVIKVGTSTLTAGTSRLHLPQITSLVQQISVLMARGDQVALVSSGAIAVGRERLGYPELPKSIPAKQMLAAIGQPRLMNVYEQLFDIYGLKVAQVLLTREDISDRKRYINARNTLESLLVQGVVPVINENDTVATDEIRIGDNDNLSALVANLIEADLLLILTDQAGLFTANPARSKNAELIHEVRGAEIPEEVWQAAGGSRNGLGTGGMATKLQAADIARRSGTEVVIAGGNEPQVLQRLVDGESLGTRIFALVDKLESRKRFMLAGAVPRAGLRIDQGAAVALDGGGSLLPVGVSDAYGKFERGDIVRVKNADGKDFAIGLVNYSSEDVKKIKGRRSADIESLLGYAYGDEVIHHNNMTLLG